MKLKSILKYNNQKFYIRYHRSSDSLDKIDNDGNAPLGIIDKNKIYIATDHKTREEKESTLIHEIIHLAIRLAKIKRYKILKTKDWEEYLANNLEKPLYNLLKQLL